MAENYSNLATTTTVGTLNSSSNPISIAVVSPTNFPAATPFRITVCDSAGTNAEAMLVTGTTSSGGTTTFTATRGAWSASVGAVETPTPALATHTVGSILVHAITAGGMDQIRIDTHQQGADNSKTEQKTGNLYLPNNGISIYRDNGTTFDPYGPLYEFADPNASTNTWSWLNQGSATVDTVHGGIGLVNTATEAVTSSPNIHAYVVATPSTPYHIILGYSYVGTATTNQFAGACFSDGTKFAIFGPFDGNQVKYGEVIQFGIPSATSYAGITTLFDIFYPERNPIVWLRIGDNGTNRSYDVGPSPYDWLNLGTETRTAGFTASKVGIFLNGGPCALRLHSFQITG